VYTGIPHENSRIAGISYFWYFGDIETVTISRNEYQRLKLELEQALHAWDEIRDEALLNMERAMLQ
jgi:hypothetical protein